LFAPVATKWHRFGTLRIELLLADGATNGGHKIEEKLESTAAEFPKFSRSRLSSCESGDTAKNSRGAHNYDLSLAADFLASDLLLFAESDFELSLFDSDFDFDLESGFESLDGLSASARFLYDSLR
jgi:hypothetical protein